MGWFLRMDSKILLRDERRLMGGDCWDQRERYIGFGNRNG